MGELSEDLPYAESGSLYIKGEVDALTGQHSSYYKVGIVRGDKDVKERDKALKTGNPRTITPIFEIESYFAQKLETRLHNQFAYARVSSGEWFSAERCSVEDMIAAATALNEELNEFAQALSWLDTLKKNHTLGEVVVPTPEIIELAERYAHFAGQARAIGAVKKKVVALLATASEAQPDLLEVLFKSSESVDKTAFSVDLVKKKFPDLYEAFKTLRKPSITAKIVVKASDKPDVDYLQDLGLLTAEALDALSDDPYGLHQQYLAIWGAEEATKWDLWVLEARLHLEAMQRSGIEGILEWDEKVLTTFDREAFLEKHPELEEECSKTAPGKRSYSVAEWAAYQHDAGF